MSSINQYIEHTNLKPDILEKDIDLLIDSAKEHKFLGVCVPPFWVKRARREIGRSGVLLVTVAGFPLGYSMTETKLEEIKVGMDNGADEIDVVMNISAFKMNMEWCKVELAKCARIVHEREKLLKVIIETAYLNEGEIEKASRIGEEAGADFIKTSTGFASRGASLEDIRLIKRSLSSNMGIKASGGIKDLETAMSLIDAGADRLGTSSGIKIMEEWTKKQKGN